MRGVSTAGMPGQCGGSVERGEAEVAATKGADEETAPLAPQADPQVSLPLLGRAGATEAAVVGSLEGTHAETLVPLPAEADTLGSGKVLISRVTARLIIGIIVALALGFAVVSFAFMPLSCGLRETVSLALQIDSGDGLSPRLSVGSWDPCAPVSLQEQDAPQAVDIAGILCPGKYNVQKNGRYLFRGFTGSGHPYYVMQEPSHYFDVLYYDLEWDGEEGGIDNQYGAWLLRWFPPGFDISELRMKKEAFFDGGRFGDIVVQEVPQDARPQQTFPNWVFDRPAGEAPPEKALWGLWCAGHGWHYMNITVTMTGKHAELRKLPAPPRLHKPAPTVSSSHKLAPTVSSTHKPAATESSTQKPAPTVSSAHKHLMVADSSPRATHPKVVGRWQYLHAVFPGEQVTLETGWPKAAGITSKQAFAQAEVTEMAVIVGDVVGTELEANISSSVQERLKSTWMRSCAGISAKQRIIAPSAKEACALYQWTWNYIKCSGHLDFHIPAEDYACTPGQDAPPKCLPGYMTNMGYQACRPNGSLQSQ